MSQGEGQKAMHNTSIRFDCREGLAVVEHIILSPKIAIRRTVAVVLNVAFTHISFFQRAVQFVRFASRIRTNCGGDGKMIDQKPEGANADGLIKKEEVITIDIPGGVEDIGHMADSMAKTLEGEGDKELALGSGIGGGLGGTSG